MACAPRPALLALVALLGASHTDGGAGPRVDQAIAPTSTKMARMANGAAKAATKPPPDWSGTLGA